MPDSRVSLSGVILVRILLSIFCILTVLAGTAYADPIKVVTEPWAPYTYSENGEVKGVVTEIVKATLDRTGLDYTIDMYPWARAYDMAKTNPNILIYSIFRLPNREEHFKWIKLEGLSMNMFLFKPKHRDDIEVCNLEDAKRYKVGVTRETSTHHFLLSKGFKEGENLFPVNSEELNVLKSSPKNKRIDLTTGDPLSLARWLSVAGLPHDYWVPQALLFKEDIYMAFGRKTDDSVVEKVRAAFLEVKAAGALTDIEERYHMMLRGQECDSNATP